MVNRADLSRYKMHSSDSSYSLYVKMEGSPPHHNVVSPFGLFGHILDQTNLSSSHCHSISPYKIFATLVEKKHCWNFWVRQTDTPRGQIRNPRGILLRHICLKFHCTCHHGGKA